jgi:1,4-dihydroxy-6-naphthoate synthase
MKLSLGFSPCPNDTFIFDAMIHGKIDTEGIEFEVLLADVEELNQKAFSGILDITKLSFHAFAYLIQTYVLLNSGSALGNNCGPLLIAKRKIAEKDIPDLKIAIPGKFTTANFLLSLAFPNASGKQEMLFSDIEDAVLNEDVDAGLIIHENRFTYQNKGLVKLMDLGEYWENSTGMPIPLGGIAIRRDLSVEIQRKVNRIMNRSVAYALDNPGQTIDFVRQYAQEMEESVMFQHINLYVNNFTLDLGPEGIKAVRHLFDVAVQKGIIPPYGQGIFLSSPLNL